MVHGTILMPDLLLHLLGARHRQPDHTATAVAKSMPTSLSSRRLAENPGCG